jgi:hypothetical protein
VASSGGVLADKLGWAPFLMAVLVWIVRRHELLSNVVDRPVMIRRLPLVDCQLTE